KSILEKEIKKWETLEKEYRGVSDLLELAASEGDASLDAEIGLEIKVLKEGIARIETELLLSDEKDINNAILSIHPGAGGTESQDWAEMLLRMYVRWGEKTGYKVEMIDLLQGDGAGIKSATFSISGEYAYGYLKSEAGVHRLVRISPFDANKRRHTSFASVFVYPEIEEDLDVAIDEKDLRIDTYRASSAGGQHVNKTSSAIRITHIPSGIVVQCQNERSQYKNKSMAMKVLRSRIYELEKAKKKEEMSSMLSEKKDIAWGSQIRSYIFQPYQMVKDHRTGTEAGNITAVMDGEIDQFIQGYLLQKIKK
ncbi:MAG TPA: peptide chain release factor 2, partial [Nitrospiria bacterium]|nr:peptide chain release factor 2 [Nitrospiria bacterium]